MPLLKDIKDVKKHYNQLVSENFFDAEYLHMSMQNGLLPITNMQMGKLFCKATKERLIKRLEYSSIFIDNNISKKEVLNFMKRHERFEKFFKEVTIK